MSNNLLAVSVPGTYQIARSDGGSFPAETLPAGTGPIQAITVTAPLTSTGGAAPNLGITAATDLAAGSMSAADKTKLDGITAGAAVASVSGVAPIGSTGGTTPAISIAAATDLAAGSMSAADKTKLDGLSATPVNSVTGVAPIASSGGQTPAISIAAATDLAAGSMSAADKTKLDGISAAPASAVGANLISLTNQSGATMNAGINGATWSYTPTGSGLVLVAVNWSGNAASPAAPYFLMEIFTGGAVGGGTVTNGVHFLVGSTPTRTGGAFLTEPIFQFGGTTTLNLPALTQIGASATCLVQLVAGTTYTFVVTIVDGIAAANPNYTNMTLSVGCAELLT